jgi:predicted MPP superfamily phosphohydrolase
MDGGTTDGILDRLHWRRVWQERREAMEARPKGRRWRGFIRGHLYHTAQRTHERVRPTRPVRWVSERALAYERTDLTVSFPDLPAAFHGYRILHLTDLHLDNIHGTATAAARHVADLDADLCVITGDIRDNIHSPLNPLIDRLGELVSAVRAPGGVMGVLGNHDSAAMVAPMESLGINVLINETVHLERGGERVHVTGLDDVHRFHTEDAHRALDNAPDGFGIALVHSPEIADRAAKRHRLYLTGHTHGGQICLPGGRPFATGLKSHRHLARGVWRHGPMVGYTNRGIGACVVPLRTFCPGEIAVVTLQRGPERVRLAGREVGLE